MRPARRTVLALAAVLAAAVGPSVALAAPRVQATRGVLVIETNLDYQGSAAAGTGMVIGAGGEVLTNNHVIRGATSIRAVDPRTGRRFSASVVGYDIADDIAVLKLAGAPGLATVTLGNSATVHRGQAVTAAGNAGGTGRLVAAAGTVTALGRAITVQDDQGGTERLHGLLQTNAQLQPGDSGGPLLDGAGRVIGIDTAASAGFAFQSGPARDMRSRSTVHSRSPARSSTAVPRPPSTSARPPSSASPSSPPTTAPAPARSSARSCRAGPPNRPDSRPAT